MSKVVVTDQLSVYGDINISYSPDNAMLLLPVLGELGFTPTTFSELNKVSSQVENRLSFIKDQIKINFYPNRIIIGNAPDPSKDIVLDFNQLSLDVIERVFSKFPSIHCTRLIRSGDYFASEMKIIQMENLRRKFCQDQELEPVEWRVRQTFANEQYDEVIFYTTEIGRAKGYLNLDGNKIPFDRMRYKVVAQSSEESRALKLDTTQTLQWIQILNAEHSKRLNELESSLNE